MESDRDKVKPVTGLGVLAHGTFCQLEATYIKSVRNVHVLRGLKIFLTFEKERLKLVGSHAPASPGSL